VTAAFQVKEAAEVGAKAGLTLLESSVIGAVAVIMLIAAGVFAYIAWKAKRDQISFMKELMEASKEEALENKDFMIKQADAYKSLAEEIAKNGKCVDALANSIPGVDLGTYYKERG